MEKFRSSHIFSRTLLLPIHKSLCRILTTVSMHRSWNIYSTKCKWAASYTQPCSFFFGGIGSASYVSRTGLNQGKYIHYFSLLLLSVLWDPLTLCVESLLDGHCDVCINKADSHILIYGHFLWASQELVAYFQLLASYWRWWWWQQRSIYCVP